MEQPAITILNTNSTMAISTVRPDGWPQTTVVGYANRGFDLYFTIFRASQKYANICLDGRISIAISPEVSSLEQLRAVYAGAIASELNNSEERAEAWRMLMDRHASLAGFKLPEASDAVFMRARCKYVSVLDFTQGVGHREQLLVEETGKVLNLGASKDDWSASAAEAFDQEGMGVAAKE